MAGNRGYREFAIANRTFAEQQDEETRSITSASVAGMNIRTQSDLFTQPAESILNDFTAVGEMTTAPVFKERFPRLLGMNHQVLCEKEIRIAESLQALNTKFYSAGKYEEPRIVIPSVDAKKPRIIFNNCVFLRDLDHGVLPFIRIQDGARVVFVGCYFIGLSGASEDSVDQGMIRIDSSTATDTQFVGCARYPDGGFYTTTAGDAGGTKTGCI
tara:strand:- start:1046 stop:1687 length:642 start_codon:yes stop_codon:yes gene_type:complete